MNTYTLKLANLAPAEMWALDEITGLFADPDRREDLRAWLEGRAAIQLDRGTGCLVAVPPQPIAPAIRPGARRAPLFAAKN